MNFLLIDATDRSKISKDQKRLFFAVSLCPLSFFANTPFKLKFSENENCKQGEEFRSKKIHVRSKDPSKIARQFENGSKEKEKGPRKVKRTFYAKVESPPFPLLPPIS